jgi:stage V sporulation protein K
MIEKKYADTLLDNASKLDAISNSFGKISENALAIVNTQDETAVQQLLLQIKRVVEASHKIEVTQLADLLKESLFRYFGYLKIAGICNHTHDKDDKRTLSELFAELNAMIGLEKVKQQVNALVSYQKVQKMRESHGLKAVKNTLHLAFLGKPGTGKTTVARIVGRIYKQIGLLSKGHFLEVSRTDLIAGYQGQTALKVKKIIEKAKGGVLCKRLALPSKRPFLFSSC